MVPQEPVLYGPNILPGTRSSIRSMRLLKLPGTQLLYPKGQTPPIMRWTIAAAAHSLYSLLVPDVGSLLPPRLACLSIPSFLERGVERTLTGALAHNGDPVAGCLGVRSEREKVSHADR